MRLAFLSLPAGERILYVEQAAARRSVSAVVLEKNFWVCWLLGVLFGSEFAGSLVFKGGTSLSKVFGVIDRFSEDSDRSMSPAFLGLPEAGAGRNQANRWMTRAEAACSEAAKDRIGPALEALIGAALGHREGGWVEFQTDPGTNSPVLLFHYPSAQPGGFACLRRSVKLEFGSLTDQQPAGRHAVRPWLAETLPAAFPDWACEGEALEVEHTFWEKATILHAEHHRPADRPTPDRFSRHYADTAALAAHPASSAAADLHELRERVVAWKGRVFGSSWAVRPGDAGDVPAGAPPDAHLPALRRDYQAMKDMYQSEPAAFDDVIATLAALELRINGGR